MSDFKITQEVLDRLNAAFETDSAKGMVRLVEIVMNAADDALVAKSKMALDMIEVILGVLLTDHIITTDPREPIERLAKTLESVQQKERNKKSLKHYRDTEAFTRHQFMEHSGLWDSIANAVAAIKGSVLTYSKSGNRPLAPTNAERQIRLWLSTFLHESEEAQQKLTPAARDRLRHR